MPRISVIVPVYNVESYLEACIRSIAGQSFGDWELLLVDDGSTDGSAQICSGWAVRDSRIRLLQKENGGTSTARNWGLAHATGEYVSFVDGDDYIDPEMLEQLWRAVEEHGADMAQVGRIEETEDGRRLPDICTPPEEERWESAEEFLRQLLLHKGDCSFCTKLTRRSLLAAEAFPPGRLNEDFYLCLELLPRIEAVRLLSGRHYHVRYRQGSNTRQGGGAGFSQVYIDNVDNAQKALELCRDRYPQLLPICRRFGAYQRLDYMLHIPLGEMSADNVFFRRTVADMRKGLAGVLASPWLGLREKSYYALLALWPRGIRHLHARLKGWI